MKSTEGKAEQLAGGQRVGTEGRGIFVDRVGRGSLATWASSPGSGEPTTQMPGRGCGRREEGGRPAGGQAAAGHMKVEEVTRGACCSEPPFSGCLR